MIGTTLGTLGGYFGGLVDDVVLFLITTRLSIPVVLVALAVVGLLGSSLTLVICTLGFLLWDRFAVVARSTTMQVRSLDYVAAARCAYLAGFAYTSNLEAGRRYGIPTTGTAAHAFTLLHDDERTAFASQVAALGIQATAARRIAVDRSHVAAIEHAILSMTAKVSLGVGAASTTTSPRQACAATS